MDRLMNEESAIPLLNKKLFTLFLLTYHRIQIPQASNKWRFPKSWDLHECSVSRVASQICYGEPQMNYYWPERSAKTE